MKFYDFTVEGGEVLSGRRYDTTTFPRGPVDAYRGIIDQQGEGQFRFEIPLKTCPGISLQWSSPGPRTKLVTFWGGPGLVLTTCGLLGGDPLLDTAVLHDMQKMTDELYRAVGVEPARELLTIAERPALVVMVYPTAAAAPEKLQVVADMETFLAAAFFEQISESADDGSKGDND